MLFPTLASLAVMALASNVAAEPVPYRPFHPSNLAAISPREMFGAVRRQVDGAYNPETTVCGSGTTCAEACGAGFQQCASKDTQTHCFNPTASQTCCPAGTGDACDAGYFCASDSTGATLCCPEGSSLADCAAKNSAVGSLVSQTPIATSAAASSPAAPTSVASITTPVAPVSSSAAPVPPPPTSGQVFVTASSSSDDDEPCTTYTTAVVETIVSPGPSSTSPVRASTSVKPATTITSTTTAANVSTSRPTTTGPVTVSAATSNMPTTAFVFVAAIAFAFLL